MRAASRPESAPEFAVRPVQLFHQTARSAPNSAAADCPCACRGRFGPAFRIFRFSSSAILLAWLLYQQRHHSFGLKSIALTVAAILVRCAAIASVNSAGPP